MAFILRRTMYLAEKERPVNPFLPTESAEFGQVFFEKV
jgi:hypothetical protein